MVTKVCSKCKTEKDVGEEFNKSKSYCRMCQKNIKKEYYKNNKDKIKKNNEEYRKNNVERFQSYRQDNVKRTRKYRENNVERVKKQSKEYRENNRVKIKKQSTEYCKTPRGKFNRSLNEHKRRIIAKTTLCTLTLEQWNKIIEMQGNKCGDIKCRKPFTKHNPPTKDHIIPLNPRDKSYKSGGLTFENTRAVCRSCNSKKSNKIDNGLIQSWLV